MRRLVSLAALFALTACGDATGILVEVSSPDLAVGTDVDSLHFVARSATGRTVNSRFAIAGDWPHSLTILPSSGMDGEVTITVVALLRNEFVTHRVVRASFTPGSTRRVDVALTAACRGVVCAEGVDCVRGMCVDVAPPDAGPGSDGGFDAGSDAGGGLDAGFDAGGGFDAGPGRDAGSDAAVPRDAGSDAAVPRDAGTDAGFDAGLDAGPPVPRILRFTEYVEGPSNDKALEILNAGTAAVSLAGCELRRYSNGSTSASPIALTGMVAAGDVYVICHSSIAIATACDQTTASISHNGNDAYELACAGVVLDSFGRVGEDPGVAWSGGGLSTADFVLTRRCTVTTGDLVSNDAFDPSVEWTGAAYVDAATSLAGLGARAECP